MAVTATPALSTFYGTEAANILQPLTFSGNHGLMANDVVPLSLGSMLTMGGTSLYNYGDNAAFASPWDSYFTRDSSIFNLPNTLSPSLSFSDSSVYSTEESDLLLLNSDSDDFFQQIHGCSPISATSSISASSSISTMHPNLVNTLKNMVAPGSAGSSVAQGVSIFGDAQAPLLDRQLLPQVQVENHLQDRSQLDSIYGFRNALPRQSQQSVVVPKVELQDLPSSVGVVVSTPADSNLDSVKAVEKSESEDIEAAVVSVDLIQNRRPFKCQHEGCNKTFKNPQTMKMHHKTHYSDGSAASKTCTLPTLTSSLKAGHNKKIPSRCPKCKKTFVGLYELRRHFGRKHSEGEKPFGCRKCGKKFYIEVDVRDHEKLCGEPIECKCGLKFAFKCNLVAHKKAHPACQDQQPNCSSSTTSNNQSSSDDSDHSPGISRYSQTSGIKRAREESTSPIQSSLHVPVPDFTGIPDAPLFKTARHAFPGSSFHSETSPLWTSNMLYPPISFSNLPLPSAYTNLDCLQDRLRFNPQHFSTKSLPIPSTYAEAVNCEMGIAHNQLPFKAWSG